MDFLEFFREATRTVLNTVERAQKLFEEIQKAIGKKTGKKAELLLAHSRFRAGDS